MTSTEPASTVVHLLRHGEVYNPDGVLYGRLPHYHLSDLGRQMADRVAETLKTRDITHVVSSPLERAQETARPSADALGLDIVTDGRVIEASNKFEGKRFGVGDGSLRKPAYWRYLYNPITPSWEIAIWTMSDSVSVLREMTNGSASSTVKMREAISTPASLPDGSVANGRAVD